MRQLALAFAIIVGVFAPPGRVALAQQAQRGLPVMIVRDERREHRRVAILTDDWLYCYPPTGELFIVPRTYETDFASVPRAAWAFLNPFGDDAEASLIHDWLYAVGEPGKRKEADEIFRYAMREQGVGELQRNVAYDAVRREGRRSYGSAQEWRNFVSPQTFQRVPAPMLRPAHAAVTVMNCAELDERRTELDRRYGTHAPGR